MAAAFVATGDTGRLQVGYRHAATLGPWRLVSDWATVGKLSIDIEATVLSIDQFWATQGPFKLSLFMGSHKWWTWAVAVPDGVPIVGSRLRMQVEGMPQVVDGRD